MIPSRFPLVVFVPFFAVMRTAQAAFAFTHSNPTQCDGLTISWEGGSPPFQLLLVPEWGNAPRNISIPATAFDSSTNKGSFITNVGVEANLVITMSDATGFGSGGTTALLKVGNSISNPSCDFTDSERAFTFDITDAPTGIMEQCWQYTFENYSGAILPTTMHGLVLEGNPFSLTTNASSYPWAVNVPGGSNVIFFVEDARGNSGGISGAFEVKSSSNSSCLSVITTSSATATTATATSTTTSLINTPTYNTSTIATSATTTPSSHFTSRKFPNGLMIGGVIGGAVVVLILLASLLAFCIRKRHREDRRTSGTIEVVEVVEKRNRRRRKHFSFLPELERTVRYPLYGGNRGIGLLSPSANIPPEYTPVPYVLPPTVYAHDNSRNSSLDGTRTSFSDSHSRTLSSGSSAPIAKVHRAIETRASGDGSRARYIFHTDAGGVEIIENPGHLAEIVEMPPLYASIGLAAPKRTLKRWSLL